MRWLRENGSRLEARGVVSSPQFNPLIRKLEKLFPLTSEEKDVLQASCSRVIQFNGDQDVVREGDQPSDCNLLLEGTVCRYKILEDGKRQIFSFHIPGDIFDAQSFLLETMDHSVATLTRCTVALIPHKTMRQITEDHPRIGRAIWKDTLVDAAIFREWMASIGRRSAYQRIAHLMCEMVVKLHAVGLADDHHRIDWPMTQNELGDALGLSLVHVNRTLQELRGENLITLKDGTLILHDWDALTRAGQFEPRYLHLKTDRSDRTDGAGKPSFA
jgi:CRP-like cAMP-binding protein